MSYESRDAAKLTDYLITAVAARKRVYLIDYNKTQVSEYARDIVRPIYQHRFKRFRRYLKHAARLLKQFLLVRRGNVSVPVRHRDAGHVQKLPDSAELIVYQAFQRRDIKHTDRARHVLPQKGQYGKECRLGLSGCGKRSEEQIILGPENAFCRRYLDRAQRIP